MSRQPLCAALAALLVAPLAFAAQGNAGLTIYHADNDALFAGNDRGVLDAGHALVHEQRQVDVPAGNHQVELDGLPASTDPEAMFVTFGSGSGVTLLRQQLRVSHPLEDAVGQSVELATAGGPVRGTLLGWAQDTGALLRTTDGKVQFVRHYASMTLPGGSTIDRGSVLLDLDAKNAGKRDARLTYMTRGLGWRAAYTATLAGGSACRMQFRPEASIANRSGRDYTDAVIKLVAGQPNFGSRDVRMYSMAAPAPMAAEARAMPQQAALGDYRSFTLPGKVDLPSGTVTLAPLYATQTLACQRQYISEDGGAYFPPKPNTNDYGAQDYRDRAIASTLAFTAPDALPAGTLRAWIDDRDGMPALLGEGGIADTPKGQPVSVQLGQSFDLRASRERTAFHVDVNAHSMRESYRVTLTNGGDVARTVTVREHPNRWREWKLASSSTQPARQTPQLLEFRIPVPAKGRASLEYTVQYTWTANDL